MKRAVTDATIKRLAEALLQIAGQAMPDSYFRNDSRCVLARKVLKALREEAKEKK